MRHALNIARSGLLGTLLALAPALLTGALAADPAVPKAPDRPLRIGLALSGGGARGIAHVGVLKVLEEMRVPIHCIAGTSMGAVVGGAYAAGVPAKRLEEVVLEADWDDIFRDKPPRGEISIRRKADDFKTLFAGEVGLKDGRLALPKGIVAGVSIEAFFRVVAEPATGISDFDKLPIPYRAMATDIETGASVVLGQGRLPEAMRASMAVPGAIAPVEIDGRLLVDGGIANNLPIDEARKLCGDVVIAVNITTPPLGRKDIKSALSVVSQLINFLGKQTVDEQLRHLTSRDVLIQPDLGDISASKFERAEDAIHLGEVATRALAARLSRYSIPADQYAELRARQTTGPVALGTVDEIRFEGLSRTNADVLRGLVATKPGEELSEEKIGADLRRIYGRGDFEGVGYHIVGENGPRAMVITPREKEWGPDYLRLGVGLETDFQGDNAFNLLLQYKRTWINQLGGEWLAEVQIGQDAHVFSELYQPLHASGAWFGSLYGLAGQTTRGLFSGDDKIAEYLVGALRGGIDVGANLGTLGVVRTGAQWTEVHARVDTGDPVLPSVRELTAGGRVTLAVDTLDRAWFPESGYMASASFYGATKQLGSAQNYQRLLGAGSFAKSWGPHTVRLHASGGTDLGSNMPAYETFTLGGPLRLSGFRVNQFSGRDFYLGRLMYYRRILPLPEILGSGLYAGASAEIGRMGNRVDGLPSSGTLYSGSVFLGADTVLGPAYLGAGLGTGGAFSIYLLLGSP